MKPEEKARQRIDQLLSEAGWVVQDVQELNLESALEQFASIYEDLEEE